VRIHLPTAGVDYGPFVVEGPVIGSGAGPRS
jgi:hypothetical protein